MTIKQMPRHTKRRDRAVIFKTNPYRVVHSPAKGYRRPYT